MNLENLLDGRQAARYIGISHTYFYELLKMGKLPPYEVLKSGRKFYNKTALNRLKKKYAAKKGGII